MKSIRKWYRSGISIAFSLVARLTAHPIYLALETQVRLLCLRFLITSSGQGQHWGNVETTLIKSKNSQGLSKGCSLHFFTCSFDCCPSYVVPVMLSQLCCPSCVVPVVLSHLCCPSCVVPLMLSQLCCPTYVVPVMLSQLCCPTYVVPVMLPQLCCPSYVVPVMLSQLCCPIYVVPVRLSQLCCSSYVVPVMLSQLCCPSYVSVMCGCYFPKNMEL